MTNCETVGIMKELVPPLTKTPDPADPSDPPAPSDNGSWKCKLPYHNPVSSGWSATKTQHVIDLVEGSLSLEHQTLWTPTSSVMPKASRVANNAGSQNYEIW